MKKSELATAYEALNARLPETCSFSIQELCTRQYFRGSTIHHDPEFSVHVHLDNGEHRSFMGSRRVPLSELVERAIRWALNNNPTYS